MIKEYTSLGFMSGTSGDGVDASIISSDGNTKYEVIKDQFFEYESDVYKKIHNIKHQINSINELETTLTEKYKEFIFEPDISIQIIVFKPINVVVKGEVARPGLYTFKARRINLYQDNMRLNLSFQFQNNRDIL